MQEIWKNEKILQNSIKMHEKKNEVLWFSYLLLTLFSYFQQKKKKKQHK